MKTKRSLSVVVAAFTLAAASAADFQTYQSANVVLGQPAFTTTTIVSPAQPNRFYFPNAVVMAPATGKVFIADSSNCRVLRFGSAAAATSGGYPEAVFGQPNFTSASANQGGSASANTLHYPVDLTID